MKVADMTDAQVRKECKAFGIPKADIEGMRKALRKARKAAKGDVDPWPAQWDDAMRDLSYAQIVGGERPKNVSKAWGLFQEAVEAKLGDYTAQAQSVSLDATGQPEDCFGLGYRDDLELCNAQCGQMPACKRVVETHPDILQKIDAAAQALDDAERMTAIERQEAFEHRQEVAEAPKKKSTSKKVKGKSRAATYEWGSTDVKAYKDSEDMDKDLYKVYKWMAKTKVFTVDQLAQKFEPIAEDPQEAAQDTVDYLIDDETLKVVRG